MNVTNGRCGSVAGAQQLIFIYRDVADRRHVRFVTKKCRTCFRESYVTVHSVHSNALRDAQKSCIRMISRRNSRVFCELCSQKTPRGTLPVNSNLYFTLTTYSPFSTSNTSVSPVWTSPERIFLAVSVSTYF